MTDLPILTPSECAELAEIEAKMTPGEWHVLKNRPTALQVTPGLATLLNRSGEEFTGILWLDDAQAIVALRNAAPRILKAALWALENGYAPEEN